MHALRSACLDERFHTERVECIPDDQGAFAHVLKRRAFARVKIEVHEVRSVDIVAFGIPLVEVDTPEIDDPQQRRQVVNDR